MGTSLVIIIYLGFFGGGVGGGGLTLPLSKLQIFNIHFTNSYGKVFETVLDRRQLLKIIHL